MRGHQRACLQVLGVQQAVPRRRGQRREPRRPRRRWSTVIPLPEVTHIFNTHPTEATRQEAQAQLRDQLRKNPHRARRPVRPKTCAGPGDRTCGFFCGRLKRLAPGSPGSSARRGVIRRRRRDLTTMAVRTPTPRSQHSAEVDDRPSTASSRIAMMRCPADGALLGPEDRRGIHADCPRCDRTWRLDQTVVVADV